MLDAAIEKQKIFNRVVYSYFFDPKLRKATAGYSTLVLQNTTDRLSIARCVRALRSFDPFNDVSPRHLRDLTPLTDGPSRKFTSSALDIVWNQ